VNRPASHQTAVNAAYNGICELSSYDNVVNQLDAWIASLAFDQYGDRYSDEMTAASAKLLAKCPQVCALLFGLENAASPGSFKTHCLS
jgi:hypothetical protein